MVQTDPKYDSYNTYALKEWRLFHEDTRRRDALLSETANLDVSRVLDIGCGAGQEMLPFLTNGARCIGLDVVPEVGQVGREKLASKGFIEQVNFVRGTGDELPFANERFDVLICRGALMFMNNKRAIAEMARVLRPGGKLFLMFQAPPYYWWKFRRGLIERNILSSIHAARVLYAGHVYRITDRQPFNFLTAGGEVFHTPNTLRREFKRTGMKIVGEMPDTNRQTPSLIIERE